MYASCPARSWDPEGLRHPRTEIPFANNATGAHNAFNLPIGGTIECGPYNIPNFGCSHEMMHADSASLHALTFALTGNASYAASATRTIGLYTNATSSLKGYTNFDAALQASWCFSRPAWVRRLRWSAFNTMMFMMFIRINYDDRARVLFIHSLEAVETESRSGLESLYGGRLDGHRRVTAPCGLSRSRALGCHNWRNGDIVDDAGIKCLVLSATKGTSAGKPGAATVVSYGWAYAWPNGMI